MPPEKINVTITLVVDTVAMIGYGFKNPTGSPAFNISDYCHFEQTGPAPDLGNGKNEEFKTKVDIKEVKTITWVGKTKLGNGPINIHQIVSENHVDVFSSLIQSGNPTIIVGTLEDKIKSPTKTDQETYSILFYVHNIGAPSVPSTLYTIDPKLEINT